jgi:hypothetical protein
MVKVQGARPPVIPTELAVPAGLSHEDELLPAPLLRYLL